ncbi:MAG: PEP-CTERM sorting domain-containing protein, partial [Planctomycetota bacterium]
TVEVSGGLVSNLIAGDYSNSGLIVIHGTDFNYDYGYITDFSGTLIGTLESGENLLAEFSRFGDAQILLVPEPATLLLVGIGAVMMRKRK